VECGASPQRQYSNRRRCHAAPESIMLLDLQNFLLTTVLRNSIADEFSGRINFVATGR
jgi:hypothetical protein